MLSPFKFKHLLDAAVRVLRQPIWLPRRLVELRCARRLDRTGGRLLRMRARIDAMSAHLDSGALDGPVMRLPADRDGALRRMLAGLREELSTMRRDLARWHSRECAGRSGARLQAAIARLNRVNADTHAAADRLLREIEEYDGARGHIPG